jgi:hypothetical protein
MIAMAVCGKLGMWCVAAVVMAVEFTARFPSAELGLHCGLCSQQDHLHAVSRSREKRCDAS